MIYEIHLKCLSFYISKILFHSSHFISDSATSFPDSCFIANYYKNIQTDNSNTDIDKNNFSGKIRYEYWGKSYITENHYNKIEENIIQDNHWNGDDNNLNNRENYWNDKGKFSAIHENNADVQNNNAKLKIQEHEKIPQHVKFENEKLQQINKLGIHCENNNKENVGVSYENRIKKNENLNENSQSKKEVRAAATKCRDRISQFSKVWKRVSVFVFFLTEKIDFRCDLYVEVFSLRVLLLHQKPNQKS